MTNKRIQRFILLFSVVVLPFIVGCSSDDSDDKGGNSHNKRVTKILEENGRTTSETVLKYDTQGRIIEAITTTNSSSTKNEKVIKTYHYGESVILVREEAEGDWANDPSTQYPIIHTYTLTNGVITRDKETKNGESLYILYDYDNTGNLESFTGYQLPEQDLIYDYKQHKLTYLNWEDNNITGTTFWGYTVNFKNSNIPWCNGIIFNYYIGQCDKLLFSQGYFGNLPKNVPSDCYEKMDYTIEGGLITKITSSYGYMGEVYPLFTYFTWE